MEKIVLSEKEQEVTKLDCSIDVIDKQRIQLGLAGKLLTSKVFNVKALKRTMQILWKPGKGLVTKEIGDGVLFFSSSMSKIGIGCWNTNPGTSMGIY